MPDRTIDVFASPFDRLPVGESSGQVRGECRGKRATCAVGMPAEDTWPAHFERSTVDTRDVNGLRALEVSPFDECDARAGATDPFTGSTHVVNRPYRHISQNFRLRH